MRVALVGTGVQSVPPTGYGGVERTIAEFSRALSAAGAEVRVIQQVRKGRTRDEYPFAFDLPRLLRRERYDVLHASTPVVGNRLSLGGIPYVYTSHSRHWFEVSGLTPRFGLWLERRAVRGAAHAIALTDRLAETIRTRLGPRMPRHLTVIPIGVDGERFRPKWEEREGTVALGVGVVAPFKRWEIAAAALRGTGLRFQIVGPVPDAEYADQVKSAGDRVELLGEMSDNDLAQRYATADLLVHPSRVEILSGVVLQGLAAGLPVLGGEAIAGVVQDGRTGFLAPSGSDVPSTIRILHDRAVELAQSPDARRRIGEAARADALDRFSWASIARRHLALYRELIDGSTLSRP